MSKTAAYPIAPGGIFDSIQGEGTLFGVPMTFVRLAGCSVGCPECDTDYRVFERLTAAELVERVQRLPRRDWVWLTGGEPTDRDMAPVVAAFRRDGYSVAVATAGTRRVPWPVDFLSVSPHTLGPTWVQRDGSQLNLVPGLNGLSLADWPAGAERGFAHRFVTPLDGSPGSLAECLSWVRTRPGWRLGQQAHKAWGLP
jgi:7-carboxy-7-deazaguanine synthase